jgi:transcriptional regulator with GAF, ATPase, and Fis domain
VLQKKILIIAAINQTEMSNPLQAIKQRFGIIGVSPQLDAALDTAIRVAPTELTVLITGESGVGYPSANTIRLLP